jgi:hypothetical protein
MQDLSIMGEPLINGVILLVMGFVSLLFGLERVLDKLPGLGGKIDVDDFDTKVMRYLTILFSAVAVIWAFLLMYSDEPYHWFTMTLLFTYAIVLLSHPMKNLEGWKMFLLLLPILIIFFVEETAIDPLLAILGWSPWVVILSLLVILQGLALIISNDIGGLGFYFSDLISNETTDIGGSAFP